MDYFDKQDFKSKSHENCNQNMHEPFPLSKNVFPDNWKVPQDGDFDFVSAFYFFHISFLSVLSSKQEIGCVCVCMHLCMTKIMDYILLFSVLPYMGRGVVKLWSVC